jgi:hypothetical protein
LPMAAPGMSIEKGRPLMKNGRRRVAPPAS